MVVRAACPRYLACPGQHPHRDSAHRLPLLEMRRGQLVLGALATGGTPARRVGVGCTRHRVRMGERSASAEVAHEVLRQPGKENSPYFWREKEIRFFFPLQKYLFLPASIWGHLFQKMYYFLLYSCQQKNNTWAKALLVLQGQDFRKLTFSEEKRVSLASQTNPASGLIRSGPHLPRRQWPPLPGGEPRRRRLGAPAHQRAGQGRTLGEGYPDVQLAVQERQLVVSLPKTLRKGQSEPQLCTRTCKCVS